MEPAGRLFFAPSASSCNENMSFLGNSDSIFGGPRPVFTVDDASKKRPFFSSPKDYLDDYYDEQLPEKKRRLTPEQANLLEKSFEEENKLEPERKTQLAKKLGLQPRQVAVWFQNRRARWKAKQIEKEYDLLKASYDSLLSDYDNIVKENGKLKSQVVSLKEKLESKVAGATIPAQESDHLPVITANASAYQLKLRVEDGLSSGSTTSAVVDEHSPQLLDSGNSFFPNDNYGECTNPMNVMKSEEDEGSDGGQNYFDEVFFPVGEQQQREEMEEPLVMADLDLREFFSTCY